MIASPEITDLLLVAMRWLHASAAIVWIGAIYVELFFFLPIWDNDPPSDIRVRFDAPMKETVQTALIVFLVSGAILTFDRLSRSAADLTYVLLLAIKVMLSFVMFAISFRFRDARGRRRLIGLRVLAGFGFAIVLLATILKWRYERNLLP